MEKGGCNAQCGQKRTSEGGGKFYVCRRVLWTSAGERRTVRVIITCVAAASLRCNSASAGRRFHNEISEPTLAHVLEAVIRSLTHIT